MLTPIACDQGDRPHGILEACRDASKVKLAGTNGQGYRFAFLDHSIVSGVEAELIEKFVAEGCSAPLFEHDVVVARSMRVHES